VESVQIFLSESIANIIYSIYKRVLMNGL